MILLNPLNGVKAIEQMFKGNFNVSFGSPPGDNNGGEPSFGQSGGDDSDGTEVEGSDGDGKPGEDTGLDGIADGAKPDPRLKVPKSAKSVFTPNGAEGPVKFAFFEEQGKRYLSAYDSETGQHAVVEVGFGTFKSDEKFATIENLYAQKLLRIDSIGLFPKPKENEGYKLPKTDMLVIKVYTEENNPLQLKKDRKATITWSIAP